MGENYPFLPSDDVLLLCNFAFYATFLFVLVPFRGVLFCRRILNLDIFPKMPKFINSRYIGIFLIISMIVEIDMRLLEIVGSSLTPSLHTQL